MTEIRHALVILGGECAARDGSLCVIGVIACEDREQARRLAEDARTQGYVPHWMTLRTPEEWFGEPVTRTPR